jgi:hypothetical protein
MYEFILDKYVRGVITAEKVQSYCPKYITQEQVDTILATPQNPGPLVVEVKE